LHVYKIIIASGAKKNFLFINGIIKLYVMKVVFTVCRENLDKLHAIPLG
jgi:hypothetical protein